MFEQASISFLDCFLDCLRPPLSIIEHLPRHFSPLTSSNSSSFFIVLYRSSDSWVKTKEQTRADERREKDRVRSMLEGYNPWGRPGGGAPGNKDHSEFSCNKTREANDARSMA